MKIYLNRAKVERRHNFGRALVFIGLGLLAGGFVYSLINPEAPSVILLIALPGALLSQVGIPLLRRWGADRRADHVINDALKGLDDRWTLMHYLPGADHALFGPPGAVVLAPRNEEGRIEYDAEADEWVQHKPKSGLLRRGGRKEIDGVTEKARESTGRMRKLVAHVTDEEQEPIEPRPLLLFINDDADVEVDPGEAPLPAVHYKKVKDWLRRQARGSSPSGAALGRLADQHGLEPLGRQK